MKVNSIPDPVWYIGGGLAVIGLLYVIYKSSGGASGIGTSAGQVVGSGATGFVLGLGDGLGVPRTDAAKCQAAMDAGDTWGASTACDAGTFLRWLFGGKPCATCAAAANTTQPYDYGQGGDAGVPYASGTNKLPDPFNLAATDWLS